MPKKTVVKKKHSRKPVQKKQKHSMSQSQSQTVHVHLHKNTHSQKKQSHMHKKTTSTPVSAATPFVAPLPMYHPLNNNVPYSSFSSTYPINSFNYQAAPLVPQPIPHAVPHPAVTHPAVPQPAVTHSPVTQPPSVPGTPHIGGVLHGTRGLFSASPISAKNTPDSTGFRSPGTDGYRSVGSADTGGTFHSSPLTQSRSSTSDPSVHSTPGIFSPGMSPQSQKELVRALDAEASAMWALSPHSSHSKSPRLTPENYFKSTPGSPVFKSDAMEHRKDTPDYSYFPPGFSPEPLLSPSPGPPTALHMLIQPSAGGTSRAHSRESSAHPSPARHEDSLSPHVLTQSQSQAPLVKTPSPTRTLLHSAAKDSSQTPSPDDEAKPISSHQSSAHSSPSHASTLSPHVLTQTQSPAPLVQPPSPIQTLAQSAAKESSRTPSPPHEAIAIPPRQVKFSAPPSSPDSPPAQKKTREPKLYLDDYTEEAMHSLVEAITPMRKKDGGISIDKVKKMLKKGVTLSELQEFILNPNKKRGYLNRMAHTAMDHTFSFTNEEKEAVVKALTPAKVKAKITAAEKTPEKKVASVPVDAPAPAKKAPSPAQKKAASVPVAAPAPAKKAPSPAKKKVPGISVSKVENKLTSGFSFDQLQDLLNNKDKRKDFLNK